MIVRHRGRIQTNDNCTGCNRCISACTVPEANIAVIENGNNKILIDSDHCINCAKCIEACPHDARDYEDDTQLFLNALSAGKDVSVLIAPAFRSNFPQHDHLLGMLRQMGVKYIYDTSFGADICSWGYLRYMTKNNATGLISQPCPAVVNYIEKHDPDLIPYLAPIHSPVMCAAIYMRKYKGIQGEIAFLSPCIAKKDEIEDANTFDMIQYNVTFRKLAEAMKRMGLDYRSAPADRFDNEQHGMGAVYPMPGGLKKNVHAVIPDAWVHQVEGQPEVHLFLDEYQELMEKKHEAPFLVDILNCAKGCNVGTGAVCTRKDSMDVDRIMMGMLRATSPKYNKTKLLVSKKMHMGKRLEEFDKQLQINDFYRTYTDKRVNPIQVSRQQMEDAYRLLNKDTEKSRQINCCSCGFNTCEEMAMAVAKGINHNGNCVEYHKSVMRLQQEEIEKMLQARVASGEELKMNVQRIFEALSENTLKSDETTSQVTQISEEVIGMKDIADRLSEMVDVLNNQLQQYITMSTKIVSISTMTKLLSMNASVEAAHAKGLGKGFAVVAEQMKTLADQSADSANEIISSNDEVFPLLEEVRNISEALNSRAGSISSSTEEILVSMQGISETEQQITDAALQMLSDNA